jgi:hypothetical protein
MSETGSDALLDQVADREDVVAFLLMERYRQSCEEAAVLATSPATDEPGRGYTQPDVRP